MALHMAHGTSYVDVCAIHTGVHAMLNCHPSCSDVHKVGHARTCSRLFQKGWLLTCLASIGLQQLNATKNS